jgi:hypothetical protein
MSLAPATIPTAVQKLPPHQGNLARYKLALSSVTLNRTSSQRGAQCYYRTYFHLKNLVIRLP